MEESTKNEATVTGVIGKDSRFVFFFSHKLLMIIELWVQSIPICSRSVSRVILNPVTIEWINA